MERLEDKKKKRRRICFRGKRRGFFRPGQMSSSNVDARLLAIGFELEKLIGHMEVMVLVFDQQVTPAV